VTITRKKGDELVIRKGLSGTDEKTNKRERKSAKALEGVLTNAGAAENMRKDGSEGDRRCKPRTKQTRHVQNKNHTMKSSAHQTRIDKSDYGDGEGTAPESPRAASRRSHARGNSGRGKRSGSLGHNKVQTEKKKETKQR